LLQTPRHESKLPGWVLSAKEYFANFFDALSFLIDMDHDFSDAQKHATNMTELLTQADILMQILSKVRESVTSFKKTIGGIPRVTIQFNQAKKLLLDALDDCTTVFDETEKALLRIVTKSQTK
jgi:hypothetical protein